MIDAQAITRLKRCNHCRAHYLFMYRELKRADGREAVALIEAHTHNDELEVYFTVIPQVKSSSPNEQEVFSCRYGYVKNIDDFACSLIDAPESLEKTVQGQCLTRAQALRVSTLKDVWEIIDYLIDNDLVLHDFFHHTMKSKIKAFFRFYR